MFKVNNKETKTILNDGIALVSLLSILNVFPTFF